MQLRDYFKAAPSAATRKWVVAEVGHSQERFDELYTLMLSEKEPMAWRIAWVLDYCDENSPGLAQKHIKELVASLGSFVSQGMLRSCLRMISRYKLDEDDQGIVADLCFDWLHKENVPVAIKVYSMQILADLAMEYPELKQELILLIEDHMDLNSAGFKSRGARILKKLRGSVPR